MSNKFGFDTVLSNFKRNELVLAKKIAMIQKNYYVKSFDRQAWGGKRWKQVKRRIPGTHEYKYPKKRGLSRRVKPILTNTGTLRRAVNTSIKSVTSKGVKFEVRLPYAQIHNEGGTMGNGRKMPKRQYMGWNGELDKLIKAEIKANADKNFNVK